MDCGCYGSIEESLRSSNSPHRDLTPTSSASSRASSPLSRGTFPSSGLGHVNIDADFSEEARTFLSDLKNYIALGCLCLEDSDDVGDDNVPGVWRNVTSLPSLAVLDEKYRADLQKLALAGWIRVSSTRRACHPSFLVYRIYILPGDVGHRFINREDKKLSLALANIVAHVDVNPETWRGECAPTSEAKFDLWASGESNSLFYLFNKLPSPSPSSEEIEEKYAREALEDLLDGASVLPGLATPLYPYQRRSAGLMLRRESSPRLELDPRLESRIAPDGSTFFYGPRGVVFLRYPRYYEACKGGILAESMGLGKTLICLAVILATKDHPPKMPIPFNVPPIRAKVASLTDMAVSAINRKSVPWKVEFERIRHATGENMSSLKDKLERPNSYEVPVEPTRWNRNTVLPPPRIMTLATTTLIVVPTNLCKQWQSEIRKHIRPNTLKLLVMEETSKGKRRSLPSPEELRAYDIVLFSRSRFEREIDDGTDKQGRRADSNRLCRCPYIGASRIRDCCCVRTNELYNSPLKHLHFKRLIIDEGHFFSNTASNAVLVANGLVRADHRWVVSGTPAKDLLGVEVDISAAENLWQSPGTKQSRDSVLQQRRFYSRKDDTEGAIKSLGSLASTFLRIEPWYASNASGRKSDWDEYIYRHEHLRKKTWSQFSTCLRRTLEAMVVKTRPEDVERDMELPPLSHEVIRLEPSFYDKLTANLFTLVLTANAVTSERTDVDYLFHKNSQKPRMQLILNLRQSAFFWTGFSEADVKASQKSSNNYLCKEGTTCSQEDRSLLTEALTCTETILASKGWNFLSNSHEIGLFVKNWPEESAEHWSFDPSQTPLLTGASQLVEAQTYVNERARQADPSEGLAGVGIKALSAVSPHNAQKKTEEMENGKEETGKAMKKTKKTPKKNVEDEKENTPILTISGIPMSSIDGEPSLKRRHSVGTKPVEGKKSPRSTKQPKHKDADVRECADAEVDVSLPPDSPLLQGQIVGTTSAKLSYLISQILKFYRQEKILVFYDGDNIAYYIAQVLELLHIKHEIYARSLSAKLKSEYVVRFAEEEDERVLLMDVKQAAFGLNLPSASRIFFVNPVCRPDIEAQAIKRAHRIGQTRKVFVETLVLKGSIEEKMLERSKRMTRSEHRDAKSLEDDGGIRDIIQSARITPIEDHESNGYGQMAPLEQPQQLWGRSGRGLFSRSSATVAQHSSRKKRKLEADASAENNLLLENYDNGNEKAVRRRLVFVKCTEQSHLDTENRVVDENQLRNNDEQPDNGGCDDDDDDDDSIFGWWHNRGFIFGGEKAASSTSPSVRIPGSAEGHFAQRHV